jgi:hypothetical protein
MLAPGKGHFNTEALAPDGKVLALGNSEGLWLFDALSGKEVLGSRRFNWPVDSLAFCSNGNC